MKELRKMIFGIGLVILAFLQFSFCDAFQVAISDLDPLRQTCSGMWKGKETRIELRFDNSSAGTVSTLMYEYSDFDAIGKNGKEHDMFGFPLKTYICTSQAVLDGLCTTKEMGNFIVSRNASSVITNRIDLGKGGDAANHPVVYNVTRKGYYCVGASEI